MLSLTDVLPPPLDAESHDAALAEPGRLLKLHHTGLIGGEISPVLERLTRLASTLLGVPVSAVSLVDDLGQHFVGLHGLGGWAGEQRGTPMSHSFCQHVAASGAPLITGDARSVPLLADNLAVPALGVIAYAGVPLTTADGFTLGAFCAIDTKPHEWTEAQLTVLRDLAASAMVEIELRATLQTLRQSEEKLREQATRDALTGLYNRRGLSDLSRQLLAQSQRRGKPMSVVVMDLNGFKQINDTFGHDAGDEALLEFSTVLTQCVREGDTVARLGGDEFVVLLADCDHTSAERFVARLVQQLAQWNSAEARDFSLRASMGIGGWTPGAPASFTAMMHQADAAMYRHKQQQRQQEAA